MMHGNTTLEERYELYLELANNGEGLDITTGQPLKTLEEWMTAGVEPNKSCTGSVLQKDRTGWVDPGY